MSEVSSCLFCRIVAGELDADTVYADERVIAFRDVDPQAPVHVLVIPRTHAADVVALTAADPGTAAELLRVAGEVAAAEGLDGGFRVVLNTGPDAGQSVPHVHAHVLGGRRLSWPPG